jgi:cytochrome c biogenesis protein CcdA/glutaredoxin
MRRGLVVLTRLAAALLVLAFMGGGAASAQDGVVRFRFFYAEDCEHCQALKNEQFPELLAKHGSLLEIVYLEISDPSIFQQMVALEKAYEVPPELADVPEVFIGDRALVGVEQIRAELPGLVRQFLSQGGAALAPLAQGERGATNDSGEPVARFFLFHSPTCPHCIEVIENYLPTVYEKYGDQVESEYLNVQESDNYITLLALEKKLGVPEDRQGSVPVLVIGDKVLLGGAQIPAELEGYIDEYLAQGGVDFPSLDDLPEVVLPTPVPAVQILAFVDTGHTDFPELNNLILSLAQEYDTGLEVYPVDLTVEENAAALAELHDAMLDGLPVSGEPEVLIDHRLLVGMDEIGADLPDLIEDYLAQGGISIPPWEELIAGAPQETATPESPPPPIYMAYFEQAGCQECARTSYDLNVVKAQYPQLVVESFMIEEEENKALNEWLSDLHGVEEELRLSTPMVFVGDEVLIGTEAHLENLLAAVSKYVETGTERTWEDFDPEQGEQGIVDRFMNFGVLTVLGAGLIDGLNPCAFATLVFFVSYLAFTGRRGRDVLFVGISFTLGVFLTYLLVGVGLLKVVQSLSFFSALGRWVYLITALLCMTLAVFTFRDYSRAREGQQSDMTLKLPTNLRRRINKVIRESAQMRAFVAVAFFTGFVVSLLELACTGQVYLPTIIYVMSQPDLAGQAFLYLLLYCLMFILPLVVVFVLSYFGTTSEQLGQFINRHTSTIKLLTGFLFVGLTLWMTWTVAPLFGIHSPWNWVLMAVVLLIIVIGAAVLYLVDKNKPPEATSRRRRRA